VGSAPLAGQASSINTASTPCRRRQASFNLGRRQDEK
jgi:hypothetical protein